MKITRFVAIIFIAIAFTASCSKDDNEEKGNGNQGVPGTEVPGTEVGQSISGAIEVYNNTLKLGIGNNVVVELHKNGKKIKSTTSDNKGKYSLKDVPEGTYTIVMSKKGYYNRPIRQIYLDNYSYTVTKDKPLEANLRLYKKASASLESVAWRQGNKNKGDEDNGIVLDITFKDLNLSEVDKYVYIYFFAGYNEELSKANASEKLMHPTGESFAPGYAVAWIAKKKIVNNKIKGVWDSRICAWIGGSLKGAVPRPTHMAIYVANIKSNEEGLFEWGKYVAFGDNYLGISDNRYLRRY